VNSQFIRHPTPKHDCHGAVIAENGAIQDRVNEDLLAFIEA